MELWVVGKFNDCECKQSWKTNGIFDSEKKAIAACITDDYFIGPLVLNKHMGDEERLQWFGCYYPLVETLEEANLRMGWKK